MTDRRDKEGTEQFHELFGTDAFLDDISRGIDPTHGSDPLAEVFLQLHHDVNAPMPQAPLVDDLLPATPVQEPTQADELAARRNRRERRRVSPLVSGLVGAAAATMLIAGTGGAIYNANPDSPLWGAKTSLFGEHAAMVDLASALEEVDKRHAEGDVDGALAVLDQARVLAQAVNSQDRQSTQRAIEQLEARIVEVPTTVTQAVPTTALSTSVSTATTTTRQTEPAEPIVITQVETVTVTTTQATTVYQPVPVPAATATPVATSELTPTPTPGV